MSLETSDCRTQDIYEVHLRHSYLEALSLTYRTLDWMRHGIKAGINIPLANASGELSVVTSTTASGMSVFREASVSADEIATTVRQVRKSHG